jgi:Icc-related predicted phosphoesterase
MTVRIAAVGDIHLGVGSAGMLRPRLETLPEYADLLLLAGDLTRHGTPEEARVVAGELAGTPVRVIAVLGNHAFGEPKMKAFARRSAACAYGLHSALDSLRDADCDLRIALTHYSPAPDTVAGEPLEIYPFLGSHLLAQAIDESGADLAVHGHAHSGIEHGATNGGVRVRNVAQPLLRRAFGLYHLGGGQAGPGGDVDLDIAAGTGA